MGGGKLGNHLEFKHGLQSCLEIIVWLWPIPSCDISFQNILQLGGQLAGFKALVFPEQIFLLFGQTGGGSNIKLNNLIAAFSGFE
jgi:hypothetical protein